MYVFGFCLSGVPGKITETGENPQRFCFKLPKKEKSIDFITATC